VCRRLHAIVAGDAILQYQLGIYSERVLDNSDDSRDIKEKLHLLELFKRCRNNFIRLDRYPVTEIRVDPLYEKPFKFQTFPAKSMIEGDIELQQTPTRWQSVSEGSQVPQLLVWVDDSDIRIVQLPSETRNIPMKQWKLDFSAEKFFIRRAWVDPSQDLLVLMNSDEYVNTSDSI